MQISIRNCVSSVFVVHCAELVRFDLAIRMIPVVFAMVVGGWDAFDCVCARIG